MNEDYRMGLAQDEHDHAVCERCGMRCWSGDMTEVHGERICTPCADEIEEDDGDDDDD